MPDSEGHPTCDELDLVAVMSALGDPVRLAIIQQLIAQPPGAERHCTSFGLSVSKSTRSYHFKVLREAGLVTQVDRGNSRMARLRSEDLDRKFPGLLAAIGGQPAHSGLITTG